VGDGLLVCGTNTSLMRRLAFSAPNTVSAEDTVVNDCNRAVTTASDGTIYYATSSQVRRLVPGAAGAGTTAAASP
jgi:hypothetical protein